MIKRKRVYTNGIKTVLCFLLLCCAGVHIAHAADVKPSAQAVINSTVQYDHVVWNGIPIQFTVPVNVERILKFPESVSLSNHNPALTSDKVSILNNNGFLYIKAKKAFAPIRLAFVLKQTGKVVLVDLIANHQADDTPVAVVLPATQTQRNAASSASTPQSVNFVSMMRFAIQQLYAPTRVMEHSTTFTRTPMNTTKSVALFENQSVMAMPLISWQGGDLYVTAVLLKNTWHQRQVLDPRAIKGNWLAVSFYPSNRLLSAGNAQDRTTAFLISDAPFNVALNQMRGYAQ